MLNHDTQTECEIPKARVPIDNMLSLAIIIVSWNVRDMLRCCLKAVEMSLSGSTIAYQIIVVDNDSSDDTAAMVQREFPQVRCLQVGKNVGFSAGNNLALQHLEDSLPPYILLLNPDTEPVGDAIPRMVHYMDQHPEVLVVGPQLRHGDGSIQSSRRRFPTKLTFFCESTPLEQWWRFNPWVIRYRHLDGNDMIEQTVDWLVGAALLVRSSAIERGGLFDETFFLYSEELEWIYRLRQASPHGSIVYLPSAIIIHYEGKSSEQIPVQRLYTFLQSRLRLAQMWHGRVFAFVLWLFLLVCYAWELGVESAKYVVGHRRALRKQRIGVYVHVLYRLLKQNW